MPQPTSFGDRLELLQTFVRIVESGSLSAAADQLDTTQPTVSRRLQALERLFGVRLLQRSTHALKLTADGERCLRQVRSLIDEWESLQEELRGTHADPVGTLKVVVPHAFGQAQLVEPLVEYLHAFPRLSVEWLLRDRRPDFAAEGIDCAIQVGNIDDPTVIAVPLFQVPRIVIGAPQLLATRKAVRQPAALQELPWLALQTYYRDRVVLHKGEQTEAFPIRPRLSTDSLYALRSAALAGLGVGIVSAWLVEEDLRAKRLVHLVPQWSAPPLPVHLVYPYARFYPARLRRFLDAVKQYGATRGG
jgi:DNA-binding transcriptional LysR family regulator